MGKEAFYVSLQDAEELINNQEYKNATIAIKKGMEEYDKYILANNNYIPKLFPLVKSKKFLKEIRNENCGNNPDSCEEITRITRDIEAQLERGMY